MTRFEPRIEVAIARCRADVARQHDPLLRSGLVSWVGGTVSGRVPGADLFVITADGLDPRDHSPETTVLLDLDAQPIDGTPGSELAPSIDAPQHAAIYRDSPETGGIVTAASPYASSFALRGETIPCLTADAAAEFGDRIPHLPYEAGDDLGARLAAGLAAHRSRGILLERHGVCAAGIDSRDAVRIAVLLEDTARTVHLARLGLAAGGQLAPLGDAQRTALRAERHRTRPARTTPGAIIGAYSTSRPGAAGTSGGSGSRTTPNPTTHH